MKKKIIVKNKITKPNCWICGKKFVNEGSICCVKCNEMLAPTAGK